RNFFSIILLIFLISCSAPNSPSPSFNKFLYSKSSMTKQLQSLDANFKVILLYSGMDGTNFKRISSLNLSNKPVIIGLSLAHNDSPYFVDLLKNANTMPIGKKLFAKNSGIYRDPKMNVEQIELNNISSITVKTYIAGLGFTNNDLIYKRTSIFRKDKEYMQVIEYILPSIHNWI
ncbi:MAG: hypothetical protein K0R49_1743, partial [Burkholderiales bacterium]|nr:hypothetical protein [Burkholderiales bacterium]